MSGTNGAGICRVDVIVINGLIVLQDAPEAQEGPIARAKRLLRRPPEPGYNSYMHRYEDLSLQGKV